MTVNMNTGMHAGMGRAQLWEVIAAFMFTFMSENRLVTLAFSDYERRSLGV